MIDRLKYEFAEMSTKRKIVWGALFAVTIVVAAIAASGAWMNIFPA